MNIKLHLHAGRRRAAGTFHPWKTCNGNRTLLRPAAAIPLQHANPPLRAQWLRNAVSGALECHWIADAPAAPQPRMKALRGHLNTRMHRCTRSAGLRPPSRQRAHG